MLEEVVFKLRLKKKKKKEWVRKKKVGREWEKVKRLMSNEFWKETFHVRRCGCNSNSSFILWGFIFPPQYYFTLIPKMYFSLDIPLRGQAFYEDSLASLLSDWFEHSTWGGPATCSPKHVFKSSSQRSTGLYFSALLHLDGATWPHAVLLLPQNGYEKVYFLQFGSLSPYAR